MPTPVYASFTGVIRVGNKTRAEEFIFKIIIRILCLTTEEIMTALAASSSAADYLLEYLQLLLLLLLSGTIERRSAVVRDIPITITSQITAPRLLVAKI